MRALTAGLMASMCLTAGMVAVPEVAADNFKEVGQIPAALIVTEADAGKTVTVTLGRYVEFRLEGEQADTGWEATPIKGDAVQREGAQEGEVNAVPTPTFTPGKDAKNESIGTYAFRYQSIREGKATLRFVYVSPGGPTPVARSATKLVRAIEVTIEVTPKAPAKSEK